MCWQLLLVTRNINFIGGDNDAYVARENKKCDLDIHTHPKITAQMMLQHNRNFLLILIRMIARDRENIKIPIAISHIYVVSLECNTAVCVTAKYKFIFH
jgi:hypothetical protein